MMDKITAILQIIAQFGRPLKFLAIPSGLLLFSDTITVLLKLQDFKNEKYSIIAIIFLVSISMIIWDLGKLAIEKIKKYTYSKKWLTHHERLFKNLTEQEKQILAAIYLYNQLSFDISNGTVHKLHSLGFLLRPNIGDFLTYFSYTLQPWASQYIKRNWKNNDLQFDPDYIKSLVYLHPSA
jgi:hypothetical protein